MPERRKIGGFFPLHLPLKPKARSVLSLWGMPALPHACFANARSALAALLALHAPRTLWLPAYGCAALAQAAEAVRTPMRFYPLDETLSPQANFVKREVKPGDALLAIDYFGRSPGKGFRTLVKAMPQTLWIEDRAQAFAPGAAWGQVLLYSPRKLLGVPDGGILVSKTVKLPAPEAPSPEAGFIQPALLRYEDEAERYNDVWYAAHVAREEKQAVSARPMSRLSRAILAATDPAPLVARRKANYAVLRKRLGDVAVLPEDKDFVPFGFPIRTRNREKLTALLHENGVFAAHHWPELCGGAREFPAEHARAEAMLTLPVDHRYGPRDMERIAALVRQAL